MRPNIPTSYPEGLPATGHVTFAKILTAGDTVTVNGVAAVYGTDFISRNLNPADVAASFAAWINGAPEGYGVGAGHINSNPVGAVWALYYGNRVTLIARVPGTAGNAITLATSVATKVTISAATLTGGANGGTSPSTATFESGTTALTGLRAFAITMVSDTVFTTLTGMSGDSITGVTFPTGLTIYGPFTAVTLTSGSVIIYQ